MQLFETALVEARTDFVSDTHA
ncbi:hypothetical protein FP2506_00480 [Fulvimarina pelagi HTCC2506]|uniref:Uncharacterized protein n=1 Tax=Fulvimarina pelagi HTCC2506 TaxID=314231 RepID=Q0FXN9_9HYPH|nr:hypothetical protein FP2506_00480 [Fulvimarina pelagi HTCC2506]